MHAMNWRDFYGVAVLALLVAGCGCDGDGAQRVSHDAAAGGADAGRAGGSGGAGAKGGGSGAGGEAGTAGSGTDAGTNGGSSGASDGEDAAPSLPTACTRPLDRTTTTSFYEAARCLFDGTDPPQPGVAPNTIDHEHVAIVHGTVFDTLGDALEGVKVTILGNTELGSSMSREDGAFDLAVNGGGFITVRYDKEGFLPSQRHLATRVRDFTVFPDVALVKVPATSVAVALPHEGDAPLVVDGPMYQDADGERHESLAFAPGTTANLVLPNGKKKALDSFDIRIAEYTVGDDGKLAMPGDLPPNSGYTYAVDYSVDQARSAGATRVELDPPAISYVENFLRFPAGTVVPRGVFEPDMDRWAADASGIVLKIVSIEKGIATIDVDGDDRGDDDDALTKAGISPDERTTLGSRYKAGTSLWRVGVPHFSAWDSNWGFGPDDDAEAPTASGDPGGPHDCSTEAAAKIKPSAKPSRSAARRSRFATARIVFRGARMPIGPRYTSLARRCRRA
jgi:hypothetical protein